MELTFIPGKPITTTDFREAKPLGMNGQLVMANWRILYELLKNRIGPECAALLLEPQVDPDQGEVDWYLPPDYRELPEQTLSRQALLQKAHFEIEQGRRLAHDLLNSKDLAQRQKGQMLLQALQYPDDEFIIATPYGPAIIAWGHEKNQLLEKEAVIEARGRNGSKTFMSILPPPHMVPQAMLSWTTLLPWVVSVLLFLALCLLPWWKGIFPVDYCRYYWIGPLVLLILIVLVICFLIKNVKSIFASQENY